jgi:hypothetical protein
MWLRSDGEMRPAVAGLFDRVSASLSSPVAALANSRAGDLANRRTNEVVVCRVNRWSSVGSNASGGVHKSEASEGQRLGHTLRVKETAQGDGQDFAETMSVLALGSNTW